MIVTITRRNRLRKLVYKRASQQRPNGQSLAQHVSEQRFSIRLARMSK